ncbi:MAG: pitrilysin family protein [candidate division WWE3 bacterium]|nr:pitrilysin family protein [candidate division WWE3 bacterium]
MHFDYAKKDLPNGVRLRALPIPGSSTVTFAVLVGAGSRQESAETSGIAHFIEHNVFKGTPLLPYSQAISNAIEGIGGINNAFTGYEFTGYWAKSAASKLDRLVFVVSDIFLNPLFPGKDLEIERGNVIEELNMYEDQPMEKVEQEFLSLVFKGHPLGQKIVGTKENLQRFSKADLEKFRSEFYDPKRVVVIAAGDLDSSSFFNLVEPIFKDFNLGQKFSEIPYVTSQAGLQVKVINRKLDQAHLYLGWRGLDDNDERAEILEVANDILGGGMASRLFNKIRDQLGLAYYIRSNAESFKDTGLWTASAGVTVDRYQEALVAIVTEFKNIAISGVTEAELTRSKEHLKGILALSLETSDKVMNYYGLQELTRQKLETPEETIAKIDAVTLEDIQTLASELIKNSKLTVCLLGPFDEALETARIQEILSK